MGAPTVEAHASVVYEQSGEGASAHADGPCVGFQASRIGRVVQERVGDGAYALVDRARHVDGCGGQRVQQVEDDRLDA